MTIRECENGWLELGGYGVGGGCGWVGVWGGVGRTSSLFLAKPINLAKLEAVLRLTGDSTAATGGVTL
jgi:hypothetical protein